MSFPLQLLSPPIMLFLVSLDSPWFGRSIYPIHTSFGSVVSLIHLHQTVVMIHGYYPFIPSPSLHHFSFIYRALSNRTSWFLSLYLFWILRWVSFLVTIHVSCWFLSLYLFWILSPAYLCQYWLPKRIGWTLQVHCYQHNPMCRGCHSFTTTSCDKSVWSYHQTFPHRAT